ncbi:MAG TPA: AAA family ATPase [Chthoniobacterales bacterium]|nr:AAA family ATPase [Chthoniobacterales bacterium]
MATELFGPNGVLLPIPKAQKGPKINGWQKLTFQDTQKPEYRTLLEQAGNIGILLGPASNHLIDIDLDSDAAVKRFYSLNLPLVNSTLQTVGLRGRHFFFRIKGPYPEKICRLEHPGDEHIGEWRGGGGAQTVIAGTHPSGALYRVVNDIPVKEIEFDQIIWPPEWVKPLIEERDQDVVDLFERMRKGLISSIELSEMDVPLRSQLLGGWCKAGDLGFIFGDRGCGKTWLVGSIACYAAKGVPLIDWIINRAWNVLWIDGEMPLADFKDRVIGLLDPPRKNLSILHHEHFFDQGLGSLNLASKITQDALLLLCLENHTQLLIIDNLSCLFSGMLENDSEEWEKVLPWLLELRRMGITVIIVHHASRSGTMRGTSKREDSAAWVIKVEAIIGKDDAQNEARFSTTFTKQRSGDIYEPSREWTFKTDQNGSVDIHCEEKSFDDQVYDLIKLGIDTATAISVELGCSIATVSRAAKRILDRKLIRKKGRAYECVHLPGDK